jgi:hypothetical protein
VLSQGSATVSGMGPLLGDAPVSTADQQPPLQVDALTGAGCHRVFTETTGGARADRPTLQQVLDILARLQAARVRAWIGGGWGIDALVGEQTRPHDDLHLAIDTGNQAEAI